MARTTATNFTGGLQFPYATAATDLFKKEDVQTLAQAVDQHTHTSGKGLVLPAGAIAPGSITSTEIADGTIQTGDLASGAVTIRRFAGGVSGAPSTSSTTFVDVPDLTVSLTTLGTTDVLAWVVMTNYSSTSGSFSQLAVRLDATADVGAVVANFPTTGGGGAMVMSSIWAFTIVAAGAHTVTARWNTASGTLTNNGTQRYLMVMEMRR